MLTLKHNLTALLLSVLVVTSAFLVMVIPQPIKTKAQTTIPDWNFGMGGDWGCTSNTRATVSGMVNRGIELNLGLGDYSYQSSAQCWLDIIRPIDSKTEISIGNHDDQSSSLLNQYMSHFGLSSQYYSFNYQNTHFTVISTEQSTSSGSAQYNFVNNDLSKAAADPNIKWKVVYFHKPIYTSPTNHGGETTTRSAMHPLFDKYGVDLVLTGHNHNFQRTYPLKYNSANSGSPTITDSNKNTYTDPAGQIYAIVGTAGTNLYSLTGQASYVVYQQANQFGWMNVEMLNSGTTMKGTYYTNDGVARDTWTINKPSSTPSQPPVANAGPDQTVNENTAGVTLNGGSSTDSDGTIASYSWRQTVGPTVTLDSTNTATVRFNAPSVTADTTLTFSLTVTDNSGASASDTVNVLVKNVDQTPPPPTTTKYNYAPYATLSGSNNTDTASSTALQLTTFSVASWFKTSTNFASNAFIVNKGGSGSDTSGQNMNYGISMSTNENIVAEFETRTGADHFITSPNIYNDGQWHYAVATYDGTTTLILYIDGVQVASKSTAGALPDNTGNQPVRIGANSRILNQYFTGNVDEVRVWNRALTSTEVSNAYNSGVFNTNGQVLYLNFGTTPPPTNTLPVANAGPDQTVAENTAGVTLNGGSSTDSDGTIASYSWVQVPGNTPTVTLTGANTATPTFTAPSVTATTTLTFRLTVTDDDGATATDDVNVVVTDSGGQTPPPSGSKYNYAPYATLSGSNNTDTASSTALQLTTFSVATWFNTGTNFASNAYIVNKGGSGLETAGQNMNYGIFMTPAENIVAGFETTTGADHFITSPNIYNDGQWHYAVATYDGTATLILYIDGVEVVRKSTAGAAPDNTGTQPVRIGANSRTLNQYFTGNADEVRVWNRALTSAEVSNAYNSGVFNTNGQVLYLNFGTTPPPSNTPPVANAGPDQTIPVS